MTNKIIYKLKNSFTYSSKGEPNLNAKEILVFAPSLSQRVQTSALKKIFQDASKQGFEIAKALDTSPKITLSPEEQKKADLAAAEARSKLTSEQVKKNLEEYIKAIVRLCDQEKLTETMISLLTKVREDYTSLVDNTEPLTTYILEKMSLEDFDALVLEYIVNFMSSSLTE